MTRGAQHEVDNPCRRPGQSAFLPGTKVTPKEMLPVLDKPVIQYVVEEAHA